ncbi:MAG: hypothetical protein WKF97_22150 [Chitinophagaceae bacterium]
MSTLNDTPGSRIVTLGSFVSNHKKADIYWDDLNFKKSFDEMAPYGQSKLANMMFAVELDKKLKENNSRTLSVVINPGYVATGMQRHFGLKVKIMDILIAQKVENEILPTLRAATDQDVRGGDYFGHYPFSTLVLAAKIA